MDGMEPAVSDRKKFDLDLSYGKVREQRVADMLTDKKIEVKSERGMWVKTGNIAIEYESYGKPSGIHRSRLLVPQSVYRGRYFCNPSVRRTIPKTNHRQPRLQKIREWR